MAATSAHPTGFPCKRNELYDYPPVKIRYDPGDEAFNYAFDEKLNLEPCVFPPAAGKGYTYYFLQMSERGFCKRYFEHTIFFKGDYFTVREDMPLNISAEEKLLPHEDKTIRSVLDPANKDFVECLKNELCPTEFLKARDGSEFSKERDGLHTIHLVGLHDDQDLEAPAIPRHCQMRIHCPEMQV